tara:strand:- start:677 stop:1375 length:699 start_codon:yes stop_codon:yes gene_type:complete
MKSLKDKWMTTFYGMDWYKINSITDLANIQGPALIEYVIDVNKYREIEKVQELGFTLVETDIEFETLIDHDRGSLPNIRIANENDLGAILEITKECYSSHNKFYNRFRNKSFFTEKQAEDYYKNSVINNYEGENIIKVVVEDNEGICAYYIIKKLESLELYGKYKGIIAGVSARARGKNLHVEMQNKITELIKEPYITVNRTQLGNYRVIGNHLKDRRQLSKIEHYFYKKIK